MLWNMEETQSKNAKVTNATKGRIMLLFKCTVCNSNKVRFIKDHGAIGLLSRLGIKTPLYFF